MEIEHGEKEIETFTCKCQFETFTQNDLDKHMESCTTINKVTCEICNKKLSKFQLTKHMKNVHSNENDYAEDVKEELEENFDTFISVDEETEELKKEEDQTDPGLCDKIFNMKKAQIIISKDSVHGLLDQNHKVFLKEFTYFLCSLLNRK